MGSNNPSWWNDEHTSTWDRVKTALRRDWEQTKADVSSHGTELNQGVTDTVKQIVGTEPAPPVNQPARGDADWDRVEAEHRYGVGARQHYGTEQPDWNDRVESKLKEEWQDLKSGRTWHEARSSIRRGWDGVRR